MTVQSQTTERSKTSITRPTSMFQLLVPCCASGQLFPNGRKSESVPHAPLLHLKGSLRANGLTLPLSTNSNSSDSNFTSIAPVRAPRRSIAQNLVHEVLHDHGSASCGASSAGKIMIIPNPKLRPSFISSQQELEFSVTSFELAASCPVTVLLDRQFMV